MFFNKDDLQVPVFVGINDNPVVPTDSTAGNGSDLIARHNLLVERTASHFGDIKGNWKVWSSFFVFAFPIQYGDKIITEPGFPGDLQGFLSTDSGLPESGNSFSIYSTNPLHKVYIANIPTFDGNSTGDGKVFIYNTTEIVTFIYIDNNIGWYSIPREAVQFEGNVS